jgi:hypothetical protein
MDVHCRSRKPVSRERVDASRDWGTRQDRAPVAQDVSAARAAKRARARDLGHLGRGHVESLGQFDARLDLLEGHLEGRREESEVAHLHEPGGEHVLQEAVHEGEDGQPHGAHAVAVHLAVSKTQGAGSDL